MSKQKHGLFGKMTFDGVAQKIEISNEVQLVFVAAHQSCKRILN
jgi:hypothetical protein